MNRRFILQRTLGEGAFGSVYLAEMESQGGFRRKVALKLLNLNWDPNSDAGRRLRDEARLLGRLQHRHIVRVDDLVRIEGRWALLMEYIGGADLETIFTLSKTMNRTVPARAVADMGAAVASALTAAWTAVGDDGQTLRVIHRDIKPSNVRLSETGDVKVLDFGVARAEFEGREAKTERVRYGSLGYMAPERLLGEPEAPSGDIYALGVLLYEMLTLDTFGRSELAPEKHREQVDRAAAQMRTRLGTESEPFVSLVAGCLSYVPTERPGATGVESACRAASRILSGDDLVVFATEGMPGLGIVVPTGVDPVAGRILEEVTGVVEGTNVRTIGTLPQPSGTASGTLVLPHEPDEPNVSRARRAPLYVGIGIGVIAVLAIGAWFASRPAPIVESPALATAEVAVPVPAPIPIAAPLDPQPAAPVGTVPVPTAPTVRVPEPAKSPTRSAEPAPTPVLAATPAAVPVPAATARLRAAKFSLVGAEGIDVTCGDTRGSGSTSALLRELPAGSCTVVVGSHRTTVTVDSPRGVTCTLEGESLTCR